MPHPIPSATSGLDMTTFDSLVWQFDPALSGHRWRAWVASDAGEPGELVAYEDGRWFYSLPKRQYPAIAEGRCRTLDAAKRTVFITWLLDVD